MTTSIRKIGSQWTQSAKEMLSTNDKVQQVFESEGDGLYQVTQELFSGKQCLASWSECLTIGTNTKFEAVRQMKYRSGREEKVISGWKAPPKATLDLSPTAEQRGFALMMPPVNNHYQELQRLTVKMAKNEYESRNVVVYPLRYSGDFQVKSALPVGVSCEIIPEQAIRIDGRKNGMTAKYARILCQDGGFPGENPLSIWLVFGGPTMSSGHYSFPVTFSNMAGAQTTLQIDLSVSEVSLPKRKLVMLEAEGYPMIFPGIKIAEKQQAWIQNMTTHGIDFFQYTGRGLNERGLAALDSLLDVALKNGMTRFKTARYDFSLPSEKELAEWKFLMQYLRSKGLQDKDIFVKIEDEQPADRFPSMAATGKWLKEIGFRPFSTFDDLFVQPELMKIISPYFDMYQGGFIGPETIRARQQDGLFKPGDLAGNYTGWGTCWQSYETLMNFGAQAAILELPFFHNHEYMRGGNMGMMSNIIMIGQDDLPRDSAAFEGLRDGLEMANAAALCRQWFTLLEKEPGYSETLHACQKEYKRIFTELLRKIPIASDNISDFKADVASLTEYQEAHSALLSILEKIRLATYSSDIFARVTWNGYLLLDQQNIFVCEGPEAEYFTTAFFKRFAIPQGERKPKIKVRFALNNINTSFKISRGDGMITVEAADRERLRNAVDCWLETMDYHGTWE